MAVTLTYTDAAKKEHVVVLADDLVFPADEDEMNELVGALDDKGQANLLAWAAEGTTKLKEPLTLVKVEDDEPEAA